MKRHIYPTLRHCLWLTFLVFPTITITAKPVVEKDPIALHVENKLTAASKISSKNIHDALSITDSLIVALSGIHPDSLINHIKYKHSLYLLLADKNQESADVIFEILDYYKNQDVKKWTILNIRLGSLFIRLGNLNEAKTYLVKALPYCDSLDLKLNKGIAKVYLADIHLTKSEYGKAFNEVDQASNIFKSIDRTDWVASAMTDLAYICISAKDYKAAKDYFDKINLLKPQIKRKSFLVRPNLFEGILNYRLGNYSIAQTQLKDGINQINSIGTFPDLPLIFQYLAKINLHNKDYQSAKEHIKIATEYAKTSNNNSFLYNAILIKIELDLINDPNYNYLSQAMEIYNWSNQNDNLELKKKSSKLIALHYERTKKYEDAIKFREIYAKTLEQSVTNDKYNQVTLLKEKNKFEKEAKETALREENLELRIRTNDKIKSILIASLSLLSFMLSFILFLFIKIKKNNHQLGLKNEKLRNTDKILAKKNEELESYIASNIQLEQFAHVASHDLRSPILTINSFAKLLQERASEKLDSNEQTYLSFIENSGSQMLDLVTDLLEYSKLNSQVLKIESISIKKLLLDLKTMLQFQADEKNLKIILTDNYPVINADAIKLKRVMQNLISNAIKFSDPSKESYVRIDAQENSSEFTFVVTDNGIGMKESKADIFQPYVQLNLKSDFNGTGMGLSVCKKIIKQHGGTIDYNSIEGKGTTFSFSISKNI